MNTLVKLTLSVLLISLLLSARPTSAAVSANSGTFPNEPPAMASSHGAVAAPQDAPSTILTDELPEAIQKALVELEGRRREVTALRLAVGVREDKIRILEGIISEQEQVIAHWKTAARERAGANAIDAKLEESYKASVAKYSVELANVRIDRDRQASRKKWYFAAGLALGIVGGIFAAKD